MSHLRDRRAFGNIGTRKFRGARYGDALSPRFTGLLDTYAGAAAAYSLRVLTRNWLAGDVVEVRRVNTPATASFTANQITNGELATWSLSGDAFVSKWYDQSGNGNDAVQATTTAQPKIVSSGALIAGGIGFDGTNDFLDTTYASGTTSAQSLFTVFKADVVDSGFRTPIDGRDANDDGIGFGVNSGFGFRFHVDTNDVFATANTNLELLTGIYGSSASAIYQKGSLVNSGAAPATILGSTTNYQIGNTPVGTGGPFDGQIAEILIFPTDQSASRVGIEANINAAYSIY